MLGYGPEDKNAVLELTYNYGVTEYDKGNAYAQVILTFCFSPLSSMHPHLPPLSNQIWITLTDSNRHR